MKRHILALGLAATTLLTMSACGSSGSTSSPSNDTIGNVGDITIPDIGNLTEECKAIALSFSKAMAQAFVPAGQQGDLEKVFGDLKAQVPAELQGDVAIMSKALGELGKVMQANNNDMTAAAVQQAIKDIGTPEVEAASNNIQAYFDTTCPN